MCSYGYLATDLWTFTVGRNFVDFELDLALEGWHRNHASPNHEGS